LEGWGRNRPREEHPDRLAKIKEITIQNNDPE